LSVRGGLLWLFSVLTAIFQATALKIHAGIARVLAAVLTPLRHRSALDTAIGGRYRLA
jgi:hypothetical protein